MKTILSRKLTCTLLDAIGVLLMSIGSVLVLLDGVKVALLPVTVPLGLWAIWHRWGWHGCLIALALAAGLAVAIVVWIRRRP